MSNYAERLLAGNMNNRNLIDIDNLKGGQIEYTEDSQASPLICSTQNSSSGGDTEASPNL